MVGPCDRGTVLLAYVDDALRNHTPISIKRAEEIDQHYDSACVSCRTWMNGRVLRPGIPATPKLFRIRRQP